MHCRLVGTAAEGESNSEREGQGDAEKGKQEREQQTAPPDGGMTVIPLPS